MPLVEVCVDSVESALAAERAGAARVELCAALHDGGTTPSAGMTAAVVAAVRIPVVAMVRPRGGDFAYSAAERDVMRREIDAFAALGVAGVALGVLDARGTVDESAVTALVRQASAHGVAVTFHRAFDLVGNLHTALETLVRCGVSRVLTSGGAPRAADAITQLAALAERAGDRIVVMAGGGIRADNVARLIAGTGIAEVHVGPPTVVAGASAPRADRVRFRRPLPAAEPDHETVDAAAVAALIAAVAAMPNEPAAR